MADTKEELLLAVSAHVRAHPEDVSDVITVAISAGFASLREARSRSDGAIMAALLLADGRNKIDAALRQTLLERIAAAIHEPNASPLEKYFLEQARSTPAADAKVSG